MCTIILKLYMLLHWIPICVYILPFEKYYSFLYSSFKINISIHYLNLYDAKEIKF